MTSCKKCRQQQRVRYRRTGAYVQTIKLFIGRVRVGAIGFWLDVVSGWLVVMHTYLYYLALSPVVATL